MTLSKLQATRIRMRTPIPGPQPTSHRLSWWSRSQMWKCLVNHRNNFTVIQFKVNYWKSFPGTFGLFPRGANPSSIWSLKQKVVWKHSLKINCGLWQKKGSSNMGHICIRDQPLPHCEIPGHSVLQVAPLWMRNDLSLMNSPGKAASAAIHTSKGWFP